MSIKPHSRNRNYSRHLNQREFNIYFGKRREYQVIKEIAQKLVIVESGCHLQGWDNLGAQGVATRGPGLVTSGKGWKMNRYVEQASNCGSSWDASSGHLKEISNYTGVAIVFFRSDYCKLSDNINHRVTNHSCQQNQICLCKSSFQKVYFCLCQLPWVRNCDFDSL